MLAPALSVPGRRDLVGSAPVGDLNDRPRRFPDRRPGVGQLGMQRSVGSWMDAELTGRHDATLSIAVAAGNAVSAESLSITLDGVEVPVRELVDDHGSRLHRTDAIGPGRLAVRYEATVQGRAEPAPATERELIRYARPTRYCESDLLAPFARSQFDRNTGQSLVDEIGAWVHDHVTYDGWAARPTDSASTTLLSRVGVCRDFAHLVIALLRACDVPARFTSVYAPGLSPMDFHAVAEAHVEGRWVVVDATQLAPRSSMVRIATGADAAETAFLTTGGDPVNMGSVEVGAVVDGDLPFDDHRVPAQLG